MPVLRLPSTLRPYAGNQKEIALHGATVGQALRDLVSQHPALQPHLFDDAGQLRPFVNVFLGEESVRDLDGLETPRHDPDLLRILANIAGG